jgi:hypothetical protein
MEFIVVSCPDTEIQSLSRIRASAASRSFDPQGTMRCIGAPLFRTSLARDLGCLLDPDDQVTEWTCLPDLLQVGEAFHVPDSLAVRNGGGVYLDAVQTAGRPQGWLDQAAALKSRRHKAVFEDDITSGVRLANARDLLHYARWRCPLGDRVRLLAALEENGALTLSEYLPAFREISAVPGLSSLILHRFVEVDLGAGRMCPETQVRRRVPKCTGKP